MKKIALLIAYFGKFPEWADLYFHTLRQNSTIDFIFYTNVDGAEYEADNIFFRNIEYERYLENVRQSLNINFQPSSPYKLCDLRPFYGILHKDDFEGYDFYGWTDMDILFGDIRKFYTNDILENYDVISSHEVRISGHLALIRNTEEHRNKCWKIYRWKEALENPEFIGIDEHGITNVYTMTLVDKFNEKFNTKVENQLTELMRERKQKRLYMKEQYTTPFTIIPWIDGSTNSDQPDTWYYNDGIITNNRDSGRDFIYLHMMNFKNSQWRHDGSKAPWEEKGKICFAKEEDMKTGIRIDPSGIHPID